ncbi:MAG: AAA family ATPase [Pseudomonadota bacterium]
MLPLQDLGPRIAILGPSNAGKSTLAVAVGQKLGVPVVHLDPLNHTPHTDWVPRPKEDFAALHEEAILGETWVMEGNYSRLVPRRFERATGAILITSNSWLRLGRYFRRTLGPASSRLGTLEGAPEYINWRMIDWIMFKTPANAKRYAKMIRATDLPAVFCNDRHALNDVYRSWELAFPADQKQQMTPQTL